MFYKEKSGNPVPHFKGSSIQDAAPRDLAYREKCENVLFFEYFCCYSHDFFVPKPPREGADFYR
jgi:hypothetical protein